MKIKINDAFVCRLFNILFFWFLITPILKSMPYGNIISLGLGFLIVVLSTIVVVIRKIPTLYYKLYIISSLFLLYCFLHIFNGNTLTNLATFFRIYGSFALLFSFLTITSFPLILKLERKMFLLGVICAAYVILQAVIYRVSPTFAVNLFGENQYWGVFGQSVRPRGLLGSVGGSASLISTALIIYIKRSTLAQTCSLDKVLTLVLVVGLMVIFTRTFVFLLLAFSVLYYMLIMDFKKLAGLLSAAFLIVFIYIAYSPEKFYERISDLPGISSNITNTDQLFKGRLYLSKLPLQEFENQNILNWVWGNNLNFSTDVLVGHYIAAMEESIQSSTHNDIVWLLVNLGVIGLCIYLFFIFKLASFSISCNTKLKSITFLYIFLFFFLSSLGGELINITGHRYIQAIFIALLILQIKSESAHN